MPRLPVSTKCRQQTADRIQNIDCRLQSGYKMQTDSPFTRPMKLYRFENAPLLKAFSERPGSDNELDRRRVNERRNAVTNETASV